MTLAQPFAQVTDVDADEGDSSLLDSCHLPLLNKFHDLRTIRINLISAQAKLDVGSTPHSKSSASTNGSRDRITEHFAASIDNWTSNSSGHCTQKSKPVEGLDRRRSDRYCVHNESHCLAALSRNFYEHKRRGRVPLTCNIHTAVLRDVPSTNRQC